MLNGDGWLSGGREAEWEGGEDGKVQQGQFTELVTCQKLMTKIKLSQQLITGENLLAGQGRSPIISSPSSLVANAKPSTVRSVREIRSPSLQRTFHRGTYFLMEGFVRKKGAVGTEWNPHVVSVISSHISLAVSNTDERKLLRSYTLSYACM